MGAGPARGRALGSGHGTTARDELLIAFDREMRENPPLFPGVRAERVGPVVRVVGEENMVIYSDLNEANASRVVREQAEFFRRSAARLEWKYFGHDRPPGLEAILASEGFEPEEPETLVVFDLRTGLPGVLARSRGPTGRGCRGS